MEETIEARTSGQPERPATGDHARRRNVGAGERVLSALLGAGLAAYGVRRGTLGGLALALAGTGLVWRGVSGHCQLYSALGVDSATGVRAGNLGVKIDRAVAIQAPAEPLYRIWRDVGNLPRIMSSVETVRVESPTRSRWTVRTVAGMTTEWEAEIINERPGELLAWRTVGHPAVTHAGSVRFEPTRDGRATVVRVSLQYDPPGGELGHGLARLLGTDAGERIQVDLDRFKAAVERGELAA
jgi:uncharacterized membrane protein